MRIDATAKPSFEQPKRSSRRERELGRRYKYKEIRRSARDARPDSFAAI